MTEWRELPLGDLTDNFDSIRVPVKEADRRYGLYPYYGASGIVDHVDNFLFDGEYLLIAEDGENLRSRKTPIAFMARGKFWVNNHAHIVQGNNKADTRFLMYALIGTNIGGYLTGSTMPKLTQGNMNRIPICAPSLPIQCRIAAVLGALDDKIERNRQMNHTLELMIQAIFKSWFIDFDGYDDLVDSELGQVPKGWRVGTLGDVMTRKSTTIQPQDLAPDTPYIGLANMPEGSLALMEWGGAEEATSAKVSFSKGDILFGKLRPYFKKVGIAPIDGICSSDMLVIRAKDPRWYGFGLGLLTYDPFIEYTSAVSTGTRMPRVSWKAMAAYKVVIPPDKFAEEFNMTANAFAQRILLNIEESRTLFELRNTLLPKLISGELDVSEIEVADLGGNINSEAASAQLEFPQKASAP